MDIITYLERATVVFNPDGTVRGSEAHVHSGYLEERDVPDAPGEKQLVFVVVKPEVRAIAAGDLAGALDAGTPAIEDAAVKAGLIAHLQAMLEDTGSELVRAEGIATNQAATIAEQAAKIGELETAVADGKQRESDQLLLVQQLMRENDAIVAELEAARAAAAAPAQTA